jgi:hypothetical protein
MIALLREADGRPVEGEAFDDRAAVFRWCLFVEAVSRGLRRAPTRPLRDDGFEFLRFHWSVATDRFREDPALAAEASTNGAAPSSAALRSRVGEAAADLLDVVSIEASEGFPRRLRHAAYGALDAARFSELVLVFAASLERERRR